MKKKWLPILLACILCLESAVPDTHSAAEQFASAEGTAQRLLGPTASPGPSAVPTPRPTPRPTDTPKPVTTPRPTPTPYPSGDEVWSDDRDLQNDDEVWPDNPSWEDYEQDDAYEDEGEYSDIESPKPTSQPSEIPKVGHTYSSAIAKYVVTQADASGGTVSYTGPADAFSSVSIPYAVRIHGIEFEVTAIANGAFRSNKQVKNITIGSSIRSIGNNAFRGCTNLKSITFGSNVESIGSNAFWNCKKLKSLTLYRKVKKIGKKAFLGCGKLKKITIYSKKLKASAIGSKAFSGIPKTAVIRVPKGRQASYRKAFRKKGLKRQVKVKQI